MRTVELGLIGCGTVGGGFVRLLEKNRDAIRARHGVDLLLRRVAVRHPDKRRPGVDRGLITGDAREVIDSSCRIVIELVGGTDAARTYVVHSLGGRKHVVTANKSLLATAGRDLHDLAETHRVRIGYEASVCGAIPIVRVLREALAGSVVERIDAVLNGTCNYILSRMESERVPLVEALRAAQAAGFAERNPALDLDGTDAAQKLMILSGLAFGDAAQCELTVEGIAAITLGEVMRARKKGKKLRLVATASKRGEVASLRVAPELLDPAHPLAAVRDEGNGVVIAVEGAGDITLYGKGAGALPTATSVLSDVVEVAVRG